MKFESILTRERKLVGFPCSSKYDTWAADASRVRLRHRGAPILIEPGHGGKWSAATRSISAANCGLTGSNHETTVSTEIPASSELYLTPKELAARWRVCRRTIEREVASKHLPQPLKIGRCLRFSVANVEAVEKSGGRCSPEGAP
jgi:predicted DNA-binding transcriptional regulator AlpA